MTKEGLVQIIQQSGNVETKAAAERVLEAITGTITNLLKAGEEVKISGFGSWKVKELKAREGRNPKTGEKITIAARKKVAFRAGKELKEAVR